MSSPTLFVLAGANGAGKSTLGGAWLRSCGLDYYCAEDYARDVVHFERCSLEEGVRKGWLEGKRRLERAIADGTSLALETTLGGTTMPGLIRQAALQGFRVRVWFFGLDTVERHQERARRRSAASGFTIPVETIHRRYTSSRENLVALLPHLAHVRVFDNSCDRVPGSIETPAPRLLMELDGSEWVSPSLPELDTTPQWAKPVLEAAMEIHGPPAN